MQSLRASLNSCQKPLVYGLMALSLGLLGLILWDEYQATKELQQTEQTLLTVEENTYALQAWVDEKHRQEWEAANTPPTNLDGEEILPPPPPVNMDLVKNKSCVADGFLSGYGGDINSSIALINRSECYYLHRALETWLDAPDFELAREIKAEVTKPNTVYGMFIAEAINTKEDYFNPLKNRDFDFDDMCRNGSKNYWGEHTCKPSLKTEEYREYVDYITRRAMDMGIQVFMFGQVFYQDNPDPDETKMPETIAAMRAYAKERNMEIIIGAQTNDIEDEEYLRLFDFIEGGVGLDSSGSVESGPCFSRWYQKPGDWCWALLWHERFKSKANDVLVHFDWSGKIGDDMSVFTRMEKEKRAETLADLQKYFQKKEVGFLMPMLATLHKDNGGCHGKKERFYSASRKYNCDDEEVVNELLKNATK